MNHTVILGIILFNVTFVISPEFRYNLISSLTRLRLKLERMIDEEEKRTKR